MMKFLKRIKERISTGYQKAKSNHTSKEYIIYMCISFSLLFFGIFMCFLGSQVMNIRSKEGNWREGIGVICILLWLHILPAISMEEKNKFANHFGYTLLSFGVTISCIIYWLDTFLNGSSSIIFDILVSFLTVFSVAYLLYISFCTVKILIKMVHTVLKFILPVKGENKSGLLTTLESVTSILVALAGMATAIYTVTNTIKQLLGM